MTFLFKFMPVGVSTLNDDAIVECSSADVDRSGEIIVQDGIDLSNDRRNPIVLRQYKATISFAWHLSAGGHRANQPFAMTRRATAPRTTTASPAFTATTQAALTSVATKR